MGYNPPPTTYHACNHRRDIIPVGKKGTLLGSEFFGNFDIEKSPVPALGVYLCDSWEKLFRKPKIFGTLIPNFGTLEPLYPAIMVDWTDGGIIPISRLDWLVKGMVKYLDAGHAVEIGCFGGHGRTGTLLACVLGASEHLTAAQAVLQLRETYCEKAVETRAQLYLIGEYLGGSKKELDKLCPSKVYQTWQNID